MARYIQNKVINKIFSDCGVAKVSETANAEIAARCDQHGIALAKKAILICARDGDSTVRKEHVLRALGVERDRARGKEGFAAHPPAGKKKGKPLTEEQKAARKAARQKKMETK